jgi:NO-binding membrane sensor protein with MHYT domain
MQYTYDFSLVLLSIILVVLASFTAIGLVSRISSNKLKKEWYWIGGSSFVMGIGIAGMHYTGMSAAYLDPGSICRVTSGGIDSKILAALIAAFALFILAICTLLLSFDSRLAKHRSKRIF